MSTPFRPLAPRETKQLQTGTNGINAVHGRSPEDESEAELLSAIEAMG